MQIFIYIITIPFSPFQASFWFLEYNIVLYDLSL